MRSRSRAALAGVVAASVALAVGELVTAFDDAGPSLVSSVGDRLVDRLSGPLKDVAVTWFGTNDKVALVIGIIVVALAVGALLGTLTQERTWVGPVGFAAFGVLGWSSYRSAPLTSETVGAAAAVAAAAAGAAALVALVRWGGLVERDQPRPLPVDGVAVGGQIERPPGPGSGAPGGASRRAFFGAAATLGVGAAGTALLARQLRGADPLATFRADTALPESTTPVTVPRTQPFSEPGLSPYLTPNDDFFRIDTALVTPRVDPASWRLEVSGLVDRPFSLDFDELLGLDAVEVPVTLQCVSNEVGGDLVGNARWHGVPLATVLDRAGVRPEGTQVIGRAVDGWTAGFPTELLDDGRTALVAYGMNGELLPSRHGFPARLIVAGLYGYVSATKWLTEIELTRLEEVDGYWIPRGWAKEGPIKTASRIDVPRAGTELPAGPVAVAGVAWAPTSGITAVELRVDDGPWASCTLGAAASDETWVQWHHVWEARPGDHLLTVRAVDGDGETQTDAVAPPRPDGATGHHARRVSVS